MMQLQYVVRFCNLSEWESLAYRSHKLSEVRFELFLELCQLYRVSVIWKTGTFKNIKRGHTLHHLIQIKNTWVTLPYNVEKMLTLLSNCRKHDGPDSRRLSDLFKLLNIRQEKKKPDPILNCSVWLEWKHSEPHGTSLNIPSGSMNCKAYHMPWFGLSMTSEKQRGQSDIISIIKLVAGYDERFLACLGVTKV